MEGASYNERVLAGNQVKLSTMRDFAAATNHAQARDALTKLAFTYSKSVLADMLEQYGVYIPLNATKPMLANVLVRMIVTDTVFDKS